VEDILKNVKKVSKTNQFTSSSRITDLAMNPNPMNPNPLFLPCSG